ncbi:MAG: hypothetical protein IPL26_09360 [Leptospiraceae bacterium]|nr:hypothetical protein [Leptospiraceae bacterium]
MKLKLFFLLSFIFHFPSLDNLLFASDRGKVKYQVEVSLDITDSAAKKILTHYPFESKNRTDYVYDVYDGKNFLLFPSKYKTRFRLKKEEHKKVIQINTNTNSYSRICKNGLPILIRERKMGELEASKKKYKTLIDGNNLLENLNQNTQNACKSLVEFNQIVKNINMPLKSELEKSFQTKNWIYLPINMSQKTKWKTKKEQITISISKGNDFIGKTFLQEKWEIEFQIDSEMNSKCSQKYCEFEKTICEFLQTEQISKADLDPPKKTPYPIVQGKLNSCKEDFGFY